MKPSATVHLDPPALESFGQAPVDITIPYTEWSLGVAALDRAAVLAATLNASIRLVAIHTVPYPMQFGCPAAAHAHLVEQLVDLASRSPISVHPQVILARSREDGFKSALSPESAVLIASRRRFLRTPEERLAAFLRAAGHKVALVYVE